MVEIYDSHEQSERVKRWLRENGGAMALGLILAFGGLYGFKQWQRWEATKAQSASAEYHAMVDLLSSGNLDVAVANYETLKAEYPKSAYTALAALYMAGARIDSGQGDLAVPMLEFAMEAGDPEPIRTLARERLARLRLAQGEPDAAMQLLDSATATTGFEAQFAEIRGDISMARGDRDAAVSHYREALALLETGAGDRAYLVMKLEALGETEAGESS